MAAAAARGAFAAEAPMPIEPGTTWTYVTADQAEGVVANEPRTTIVRVAGTVEYEKKRLLKFETLNGETLLKTELCDVGEHGVICYARANRTERMMKLDPPETPIELPLKPGGTWETDGLVADNQLHLRFNVAGEEDVFVPAGKFRAFRLHTDATTLMSISFDRWFAPGVGIVKEEATMRGPGGSLLQRTRMELQKRPELLPLPTPTPTPEPTATPAPEESPAAETSASGSPEVSVPSTRKRLTVEVSDNQLGGMKTKLRSNVQAVYVRWHARGLPDNAKVRVAWVAEDVGDIVEPNFIVDQTETIAPAPDCSARFTLGRPEDGWAEGKYRVEFYINDQLEETIPVTITE